MHCRARDRGRGLRLLALLAAFIVACAPTGNFIIEQTTPPTSTFATTLPPPADISLGDLEDILPTQPQFRGFTRDEPPTFAEYEKAVFATVACIEALGHKVYGPGLASDPDFPIRELKPGIASSQVYSFGVVDPEPGTNPVMTVDAAIDFCYEWSGLNRISLAREPSEEDVLAWYQQFRACLEAEGVTGVNEASDEELVYLEWPVECLP